MTTFLDSKCPGKSDHPRESSTQHPFAFYICQLGVYYFDIFTPKSYTEIMTIVL